MPGLNRDHSAPERRRFSPRDPGETGWPSPARAASLSSENSHTAWKGRPWCSRSACVSPSSPPGPRRTRDSADLGTPPVEAVKYQILVMFLIAGGTGFGTVVAVSFAARRLFDERQRLRLDRLSLPGN